jgi:hypothetical protein
MIVLATPRIYYTVFRLWLRCMAYLCTLIAVLAVWDWNVGAGVGSAAIALCGFAYWFKYVRAPKLVRTLMNGTYGFWRASPPKQTLAESG